MKSFQRFFAVSLSLALLAVSPGLLPYQAAAQVFEAPGRLDAPGGPGAFPVDASNTAASVGLAAALPAPVLLPGLDLPSLDSLPGAGFSKLPSQAALSRVSPRSAAFPRPLETTFPRVSSRSVPIGRGAARPTRSAADRISAVAAQTEAVSRVLKAGASDAEVGALSGRIFDENRETGVDAAVSPRIVEMGRSSLTRMGRGREFPGREEAFSRRRIRSLSLVAAGVESNPSFRGPGLNANGSSRQSGLSRGDVLLLLGCAAAGLIFTQVLRGGLPALAHLGRFAAIYGFIVLPSIIWHERGHAAKALKLGDDRDMVKARLSLNPMVHIDPLWTIALPIGLMLLGLPGLGAAIPVQVNDGNFDAVRTAYAKNDLAGMERARINGMAKVALAGPLANFQLAAAGAVAYRLLTLWFDPGGFLAMGVEALVQVNLMLGLFNLLPVPPLDGHHLARAVPILQKPMEGFSAFVRQHQGVAFVALWLLSSYLMRPIFFLTNLAMDLLLAAPIPFLGHSAALFSLLGVLAPTALFWPHPPSAPLGDSPEKIAPGPQLSLPQPADFVLEIPSSRLRLTRNIHVKNINPNLPDAADRYRKTQQDIEAQLSGVVAVRQAASRQETLLEILRRHDAVPYATYEGINMATIKMDAEEAPALAAELRTLGIRVWDNYRIELPKPIPAPEDRPRSTPVTLGEMARLINADRVQDIVRQKYGPPDVGALKPAARLLTRFFMRVVGAQNPSIPLVIIDSSVDRARPNLGRAVKEVLNATSADDKDDIGHGTHVTSTIVGVDPWQRDITMIKTFVEGGATLDDILRAQTMAADKGIISSNSWGNSQGDPTGPEAKKAAQNAQAGQIGVYAAGNDGPSSNTIGSPAIVVVTAPDGARRVLAVASADRAWRTSSFSSRGGELQPGKPDITGIGQDLEAQWPEYLGDYDRVDPDLGPVKAISGTSMATPNVSGAISLLARAFNVTSPGPALDKIVKAVYDQAAKKGLPEAEQGAGALDVYAAYKAVEAAGLTAYPSSWTKPLYQAVGGIFKALERVGARSAV